MNRDEWYEHYSAARMLLRARFHRDAKEVRTDNRGSDLVWAITYKVVEDMGHGILTAVFSVSTFPYSIKEYRWAIKYNHRAFSINGR